MHAVAVCPKKCGMEETLGLHFIRWLMNIELCTIAGTLAPLHTIGQVAIMKLSKSRKGTPQKQLATKTGENKTLHHLIKLELTSLCVETPINIFGLKFKHLSRGPVSHSLG